MNKQRYKQLLQEKNITQDVLAKDINITGATLSRNINGVHLPRADVVQAIANYFGVSIEYLMGTSDVREPITRDTKIDEFLYALYGETKDLTEEQKKDLLDMVKIFRKNIDKK